MLSSKTLGDTEVIKQRLGDKRWRLNNLYWIRDAEGRAVQFKMNWAQQDLFDNLWYFNVILKARQLGFSTFIQIYLLDHCLFVDNQACGVIAQGLYEAQDLFENKVKFAYDHLPEWLRNARTCTADSARKLVFNNGSSITVGTSLRSGTFQKLHISEFGKISARYPDKAEEIVTGALNTVHPGQMVFVESTAEGRSGRFYELCMRAIRLKQQGSKLTALDPRIHFYPWYKNPLNKIKDVGNVSIDDKMQEYFWSLGSIEPEQKAWYAKKLEQMADTALMKREHPGTWEECFEASLEGAYYSEAMGILRRTGGIGVYRWKPNLVVDTFWDIGLNDKMCIWFMQVQNGVPTFVRFYQNSGQGMGHYAKVLNNLGYVYGTHYLPHDGHRRQIGEEIRNTREIAEGLGIRPTAVVPRTSNRLDDIQKVRTVIPTCRFDAEGCVEGIAGLDAYRKKWNDRLGEWDEEPYHDGNSDIADAFRTFVVGYRGWSEGLEAKDAYAVVDDNLLD